MGNKGWSAHISEDNDEDLLSISGGGSRRKKKKKKGKVVAIEDYMNKAPPKFKVKTDKLGEEELVRRAKQFIEEKDDNLSALFLCSEAIRKNERYIEGYLERAQVFINLGKFDLARADFDSAVEKDPENAKVRLARGVALTRQEDYLSAVEELKKCIELSPDDIKGYVSLGNCYFRMKYWEEAEANYKLALEKDGECKNALHNLGSIYIKTGKIENAKDYFNKVLVLDDKFAKSIAGLGRANFALKKYDLALEYFNKSIEIQPENNSTSYREGGNCLYNLKRYNEGIQFLKKAIQQEPHQREAYITLAGCHRHLKEFKKALRVLDNGLAYLVGDLNILIEKAPLLTKLAKYNECNENLDLIIKKLGEKTDDDDDDNDDKTRKQYFAEAYLQKGNVFFKITKMKKALSFFDKSIEYEPENGLAWERRGTVHYAVRDYETSYDDFTKAKELDPELKMVDEKLRIVCREGLEKCDLLLEKTATSSGSEKIVKEREEWVERMKKLEENWIDPRTVMKKELEELNIEELVFRGNLCYDLGKLEDGLKVYQLVLEKEENKSKEALNGIGACYFRMKKYEESLEYFKKSLKIDGKYMKTHQLRGDVLKELKKYKKAIDSYKKASDLDVNDPKPLHDMGICYYFLGEYDKAVDMFTASIKCNPRYIYAISNRGESFLKLKRFKDAHRDFLSALRHDAKFEPALRGKRKCEKIFDQGLVN